MSEKELVIKLEALRHLFRRNLISKEQYTKYFLKTIGVEQ